MGWDMRAHIFGAGLGLFMLGACGGGGGSGSGSGGGTPAIPSLNVTLSASETTATIEEDDVPASVSFTATSSGSVSTPVFADVVYDPEIFASVNVTAGATSNAYTVTATPRPDIGGGDFDGKITFRLCMEAACTRVYGGSTRVHNHKLKVQLRDWVMFQRDAAHTGYVNVRLDASKFKKAWEWQNPSNNLVSAVISANGSAYFSAYESGVYSLDEMSGAKKWKYDTDDKLSAPGALTYHNGNVYVPGFVVGGDPHLFTGNAVIRSLNANTGEEIGNVPYKSQWRTFNSPTVFENKMYYSQGYYGGVVYAYDLDEYDLEWEAERVYTISDGGQTPAVDENYVYYSSFHGLVVYDKESGNIVANIDYLRGVSGGYDEFLSPVITKSGKVIYTTRNDNSGLAAADINKKSVIWKTDNFYPSNFSVGRGIIYASSSNPTGMHAIDENNGNVIWKWNFSESDPYASINKNIIVCNNIVFVSSSEFVYAIDSTTHKTIWKYEGGGMLSLSSNYLLYISSNKFGETGKITAISLR